MYQASGIFAPLTVSELAQLDQAMLDAYADWSVRGTCDPRVLSDITDIRRDVNAEWGNR